MPILGQLGSSPMTCHPVTLSKVFPNQPENQLPPTGGVFRESVFNCVKTLQPIPHQSL